MFDGTMRRALATGAALLLAAALGACSGKRDTVHIVVETRLAGSLEPSLEVFTADLAAAGYRTSVDTSLDGSTRPATLRAALQRRWEESGGALEGVILVGEFGAALFNAPGQQGDPYWHDQLVDLYYMDVDGTWLDTDGNGVLDRHASYAGQGVGRVLSWLASHGAGFIDRRGPEFWVSRLRAGTLGSLGTDEVELYRDYFRRNHAYRTGGSSVPPRAFLIAPGAWLTKSDWGARPARLYRDVQAHECQPESSTTLRAHLADRRGWSLGIVGSFSGPQVHKFHYYEGGGFDERRFSTPEGRRLIDQYSLMEHAPADFTSVDVARIRPNVLFWHLLSSETGRHDYPGYLGGAFLFFGSGLAVIAGTQHSGAIGVPAVYDALAAGKSVGASWLQGIVWSLAHPGPHLKFVWCGREEAWDPSYDPYRAVLLGDGTLGFPTDGRLPSGGGSPVAERGH